MRRGLAWSKATAASQQYCWCSCRVVGKAIRREAGAQQRAETDEIAQRIRARAVDVAACELTPSQVLAEVYHHHCTVRGGCLPFATMLVKPSACAQQRRVRLFRQRGSSHLPAARLARPAHLVLAVSEHGSVSVPLLILLRPCASRGPWYEPALVPEPRAKSAQVVRASLPSSLSFTLPSLCSVQPFEGIRKYPRTHVWSWIRFLRNSHHQTLRPPGISILPLEPFFIDPCHAFVITMP